MAVIFAFDILRNYLEKKVQHLIHPYNKQLIGLLLK